MNQDFLLKFNPEGWSEIEKFAQLHAASYKLDWHGRQALSGITGHLQRAATLLRLAALHVQLLDEDKLELDKKGYSSATRSKEMAAIIEAFILGIYSAVDCTRKVCTCVFEKYQGVPDSTSKFFTNGKAGKIDLRVPAGIRAAFADSEWQEKLMKIRDEITHFDVGSCGKDNSTGKVHYMHSGLGSSARSMVISDILQYAHDRFQEVLKFINKIALELNELACDHESQQVCGIYQGRFYSRIVRTKDAKTFHDGVCLAHTWFEQENNPKCPLAPQCGAYARAKSPVTVTDALPASLA